MFRISLQRATHHLNVQNRIVNKEPKIHPPSPSLYPPARGGEASDDSEFSRVTFQSHLKILLRQLLLLSRFLCFACGENKSTHRPDPMQQYKRTCQTKSTLDQNCMDFGHFLFTFFIYIFFFFAIFLFQKLKNFPSAKQLIFTKV